MSHHIEHDAKILAKPNKILLMGNPNVGKSVFFSELTGINVVSSNFAGTTVNFVEGRMTVAGQEYSVIDVPGTYSLEPTSEAEAVAARFMESSPSAVICVLDASNLERNLRLAMDLRAYKVPLIYVLNLMDVAERQGVTIDMKKLEAELGAPVIKAVAVKKEGLDEIKATLEALLGGCPKSACDKCYGCHKGHQERYGDMWTASKEVTKQVSRRENAKPSRLDKLGDAMVKPWPGLPISIGVLGFLISAVVFGGRMLRVPLIMLTDDVIIPFFRNIIENIAVFFASEGAHLSYRYLYYQEGFSTAVRTVLDGGYSAADGFGSLALNVLIGEYGIFVISFQWIIALILPYVFAFYASITFLEDSGYLPRVSVLFDNIMRKLGVQGGSLIHAFLALGCAIPAILGSRTATTKKERRMIAIIICFAIPCISQIGALAALMGAYSWWMSAAMVLFALFVFLIVAFIAGKIIKGKVDPLIIEVPNLLLPKARSYGRKLMIRMKHFLKDAELPMLIAVFIAALLAGTGILTSIANNEAVQAVVANWLGLPAEAVVSLILGIVRREMSVAPLILLNLSYLQVFVAGVVSLLYLPCLSVFGILAKEFKIRFAIIVFIATVTSAILVGGIINQIGQLFM